MTNILHYIRHHIAVLLRTIAVLIYDPRKKLAEVMPEFIKLRETLKELARQPQHALAEPLLAIVDFFDVVSKWHDRGLRDVIAPFEAVNYGQWDGVIERLQALSRHFQNAGRNQFGWNRTKYGEAVTAEKVFLGNVFGLFTHPVPFWLERRHEKKGAHPDFPEMNAYDLVAQQAREFVHSHALPMIGIITDLWRLLRK